MRNFVYPEYVRKFKPPKTTVQYRNGVYLVYKVTSVRVPGKKNPQPRRGEYLGIIDEKGFHPKTNTMISSDAVCYEYGYSKLCLLYEKEFVSKKTCCGHYFTIKEMKEIYRNVIISLSPSSLLYIDPSINQLSAEQLTKKYSVSISAVSRAISNLVTVDANVLNELKTLCCVVDNNNIIYAKPCPNLKKKLDDIGINWEELRDVSI